jgi:hypothetical protein
MGKKAVDFPLGVLKVIFYFISKKGDSCVFCFMHPKLIFPSKPTDPSMIYIHESLLDLFNSDFSLL